MSALIARILIVAASVTHASASCAYGTHLSPRAEEGAPIKVNTFGYTGVIVRYSRLSLTCLARLLSGYFQVIPLLIGHSFIRGH